MSSHSAASYDPGPDSDLRVAVIGAGLSGLAAGHELLRKGFDDFVIFEASDSVGGTWHRHTYPGLSCDVKAAGYTFSYGPDPGWTHTYASQAEIERYLQRCSHSFGLDSKIRFESPIVSARYQPKGTWELRTHDGEFHEFDVVVNAMGPLHTPAFPEIPGLDRFRGPHWHSTNWNHDVPLEGKRIVVVGSAAAAIQIVPELAKVAGHLHVLQRTASWVMPRNRKPLSSLYQAASRFPLLRRALRRGHLEKLRMTYRSFVEGSKIQKAAMRLGQEHLERSIRDPELRRLVTPHVAFGCNRPLTSDDYYPSLERENVTLVPSGAGEILPDGLVTEDGVEIQADVLIYCTGYKVMDFDRIDVTGVDGESLGKRMAENPAAYSGLAVPGFPNFFFVVGPNALLPSTSYFDSAELGAETIVRLLEEKQAAGARAIDVKPEALRRHSEWILEARKEYSWGLESCASYYRTPAGDTPFLFPGNFKTFVRQHRDVGLNDFDLLQPTNAR